MLDDLGRIETQLGPQFAEDMACAQGEPIEVRSQSWRTFLVEGCGRVATYELESATQTFFLAYRLSAPRTLACPEDITDVVRVGPDAWELVGCGRRVGARFEGGRFRLDDEAETAAESASAYVHP